MYPAFIVMVPADWFMEARVPRKTISWITADAGAAARITTAAAINKVKTTCFFITINSVLKYMVIYPMDKKMFGGKSTKLGIRCLIQVPVLTSSPRPLALILHIL